MYNPSKLSAFFSNKPVICDIYKMNQNLTLAYPMIENRDNLDLKENVHSNKKRGDKDYTQPSSTFTYRMYYVYVFIYVCIHEYIHTEY